MKKLKRKITVCGSFGFGNAGDEAVLPSYVSLLKAAGYNCDIDVLSRYADPDIDTVIGTGNADRLDNIRNYPIVASGGGIVEPLERATVLRCKQFLSQRFTSNIAYIGVSVEPGVKYNWRVKHKILKVLQQSTLPCIYTRDMLSEITLRRLYPKLEIQTVGDLVLWLEASSTKPTDFPRGIGKYIAVSLSGCWSNEPEWYDWIVTELIELAKEHDANLVFVPMSSRFDDDRVEHKKIAALIMQNHIDCMVEVVEMGGDYCPEELAAIYRDAMLVVSMRLHGCVISYGQRTPFVGVSYHPKLVGFSYTVGLRECVVPMNSPNKQSSGAYGFRFKDLELSLGDLSKAAALAIDEPNFNSLDYYKRESLSVMKLFLASVECSGYLK